MESTLTTLKALAEKNRLRIMAALHHADELCACQITELLQVSGATASRHLSQLTKAGLLGTRKEGRWIYFFILPQIENQDQNQARNRNLLDWLSAAIRDSRQALEDRNALDAILACDKEEICRRQRGESCCPSPKQ